MPKYGSSLRSKRGATAAYVAVALPAIGMFAALGIEVVYLGVVQQQLEGVSEAAAHAASLELDRSLGGLDRAEQAAIDVVEASWVNSQNYVLTADDVIFGFYNQETGVFTESEDPAQVDSVRVPLVEHDVGLGFGQAFFGKVFDVTACTAVMEGAGNANTGTIGGPGLANGHFDYDTTDPRYQCTGDSRCDGTTKHTHEYDDDHDVTWADNFSSLDGHLPIDGCMVDGKKQGDCTEVGASRTVPDDVRFRITVANADLSPGAWVSINNIETDVTDYDDTPFNDLPIYTLGFGPNQLTELSMNFDVNAIANCELIPTNTGEMKKNTPGILGEWRSGSLTMQVVDQDAILTPGESSGDHDVVISQNDGLLWESTYFWHWDGPSYIVAEAEAWQAQYDQLDCGAPQFIDSQPGSSACN
jgi:hypothetical protein